MRLQYMALTAVGLLLSSCASVPVSRQVPAYPAHGQTIEQMRIDLFECEQWARNEAPEPGRSALGGAGAGAIITGGFGAAFGAVLYALIGLNPGEGAVVGAALGGLTGAATGAASAASSAGYQQRGAFAACMTARGYIVAP